jgi:hypothetical protein
MLLLLPSISTVRPGCVFFFCLILGYIEYNMSYVEECLIKYKTIYARAEMRVFGSGHCGGEIKE